MVKLSQKGKPKCLRTPRCTEAGQHTRTHDKQRHPSAHLISTFPPIHPPQPSSPLTATSHDPPTTMANPFSRSATPPSPVPLTAAFSPTSSSLNNAVTGGQGSNSYPSPKNPILSSGAPRGKNEGDAPSNDGVGVGVNILGGGGMYATREGAGQDSSSRERDRERERRVVSGAFGAAPPPAPLQGAGTSSPQASGIRPPSIASSTGTGTASSSAGRVANPTIQPSNLGHGQVTAAPQPPPAPPAGAGAGTRPAGSNAGLTASSLLESSAGPFSLSSLQSSTSTAQQQPPQAPPQQSPPQQQQQGSSTLATSPSDRQSALLSLLSNMNSSSHNQHSLSPYPGYALPSSPEGSVSSNLTGTRTHEPQGKMLLEQLMEIGDLRSGVNVGPSSSAPSNGQQGVQQASSAPSTQIPSSLPGPSNFSGYTSDPNQQQGQQQQPTKSMFDFVSPFDALPNPTSGPASNSASATAGRKSPPPPYPPPEPAGRPLPAVPHAQYQPRFTTIDISTPPGGEGQSWARTQAQNVNITPIALLKLESVYLPGTTIGVADFIAYAMTKGRVRLIDRLQGYRALLKLPQPFPNNSTLIDMYVTDTRIAGVTSDGGLVVWDIPSMESEDPPVYVVLVIPPGAGLKSVRPYPGQHGDYLGLGTDKEVWIINVSESRRLGGGSSVVNGQEVRRNAKIVSSSTSLVGFAFSPVPAESNAHPTLGTLTVSSELTFYSIVESEPRVIWRGSMAGPGQPSSLNFVSSEGPVVGRREGTIFQLLNGLSNRVVEEVKFETPPDQAQEDEDDEPGFGHTLWDERLGALWVAHSKRASLFALRPAQGPLERPVGFLPPMEFPVPDAMISITLGYDVPFRGGGESTSPVTVEHAVTAFCVHTGGVHQVQITRDVWDEMVSRSDALATGSIGVREAVSEMEEPVKAMPSAPLVAVGPPAPNVLKTQVEKAVPERMGARLAMQVEDSGDGSVSRGTTSGTTTKSKKEKEKERKEERERERREKEANTAGKEKEVIPKELVDNPMGAALTKEIRKVEDNLQGVVSRLLIREMEKQQKHFDDVRAADEKAEYYRQETMLKLISNELTKNTARMVEAAVKAEVQGTVLPALEALAKNEIRSAINGQIAKGLADSMRQSIPNEIEKLLLRPDVSSHVARTFSQAVTPMVERNVKDTITRSLIPAYQQNTQLMQDTLMAEMHREMLNVKKEVIAWQSETLQNVETSIREIEQSLLNLNDQVRALSLSQPPKAGPSGSGPPNRSQGSTPTHNLRSAPGPNTLMQSLTGSSGILGQAPQTWNMVPPPQQAPPPPPMGPQYSQPQAPYSPPTQQYAPPPQHQPPPQQAPQQAQQTQFRPEDWDEAFLTVLTGGDSRQLRDLLAKCNADVIMPSNGQPSPLSQAVLLTVVTRLSSLVSELSPEDDTFDFTLRWLQRAAVSLTPSDRIIAPYVQRVLPSVQQTLGNLNQRLALLPGGARLLEANHVLSQIQQTLSNKPLISL